MCQCNSGFERNGDICANVNECNGENNCDTYADCIDNQGSYVCKCKNGFAGDGKTCDDVDECEENPCDENASCSNSLVFLKRIKLH